MRVTQVKVSAVVPTAQYSNLQPEITVEVDNGDVEAAKNEALRHIEAMSAQYAEAGKALPQLHATGQQAAATKLIELHSELTGGHAFFDEAAHVYTNQFGQKYLSGSAFASKFSPEFNADFILPKMEAKYGVPAADIKAMWACNAEASQHVGTAIHAALELYGKYKEIGLKLDAGKDTTDKKWSHVHKNTILRNAVVTFYEGRQDETAMYEAFVVDEDSLLCGAIDRLLITGEKCCRVQDFKTNFNGPDAKGVPKLEQVGSPKMLSAPFSDMPNTKLNEYWLQLSFYAHILQLSGWTVEGLDIFCYDGGWTTYTHEVVDITGAEILHKVTQ